MNISIAGQHIEVTQELQTRVREKINTMIARYFDHATSAAVHFTKHAHNKLFLCDIVVHEGTGSNIVIKSDATSFDVNASFDEAAAKAERRLKKYKAKLKDRHNKIKLSEADVSAIKYIFKDHDELPDNEHSLPVTIAEQPVTISKLNVSDAIMRMELENLPAMMFKNAKTDRMNVVYQRADGNVAWVDSR